MAARELLLISETWATIPFLLASAESKAERKNHMDEPFLFGVIFITA